MFKENTPKISFLSPGQMIFLFRFLIFQKMKRLRVKMFVPEKPFQKKTICRAREIPQAYR